MAPPPPPPPPTELMDELVAEILLRLPPDDPAHLVRLRRLQALAPRPPRPRLRPPLRRRPRRAAAPPARLPPQPRRPRPLPLRPRVHLPPHPRRPPQLLRPRLPPRPRPPLRLRRRRVRRLGPPHRPRAPHARRRARPLHALRRALRRRRLRPPRLRRRPLPPGLRRREAPIRIHGIREAHACFFSIDTRRRSVETVIHLDHEISLTECSPALVDGALHFCSHKGHLLRYDVLGGRELSVIEPPETEHLGSAMVMVAEDGSLGLASLHDGSLYLWSRTKGPDGDAGWVQQRVIRLGTLLPAAITKSPAFLIGFAEGANVVFVSTDVDGVFTIKLDTLLTRKVCEMGKVKTVFPYVGFYTPAARASGELPSSVGTL
ncbi:hypothetical protein ACP4OV_027994 [Aristida adscensionis]